VLTLVLLAPILILAIASVVLIVRLKNRLGLRSNQVAPRLMKFLFGWGGLVMLAWVAFVMGSKVIAGGPQGPLLLFLLPWAFTAGAAIGLMHWYWKHYAT
jgi:hypothetical protein